MYDIRLGKGFPPDALNARGQTALELAVEKGFADVIGALIQGRLPDPASPAKKIRLGSVYKLLLSRPSARADTHARMHGPGGANPNRVNPKVAPNGFPGCQCWRDVLPTCACIYVKNMLTSTCRYTSTDRTSTRPRALGEQKRTGGVHE